MQSTTSSSSRQTYSTSATSFIPATPSQRSNTPAALPWFLSSRRTYTSTASSQYPLPARPDWAVGLKPSPTLHSPQRSGPMPPPQSSDFPPLGGRNGPDFPPLGGARGPGEFSPPRNGGAWGGRGVSYAQASAAPRPVQPQQQQPPQQHGQPSAQQQIMQNKYVGGCMTIQEVQPNDPGEIF